MKASFLKALELNSARSVDSFANRVGRLAGIAAGEILIAQRGHFDLDINPVEQGAGDFGAVALNLERSAAAFLLRIGKESARAFLRYLSAM